MDVKEQGAQGDGVQDDTEFIQAAIDRAQGRPVYLPPGQYRVTTPLVHRAHDFEASIEGQHFAGLKLVGAGQDLTQIISEVPAGSIIKMEMGQTGHAHTIGSVISSFSIRNRSGSADGIEISGAHHFLIDNIVMENIGGNGITIAMHSAGDVEACVHGAIQYCRIGRSSQNGIAFRASVAGAITASYVNINKNYIFSSGGVGIQLSGVDQIKIEENSIFANRVGGIHAYNNGTQNRNVFIERNELGNGNPFNIMLDSMINGRIFANRHVRNNGEVGNQGIVLGSPDGLVRNIICEQDYFIAGDDNQNYTAYYMRENTEGVRIFYPFFGQFDGSLHTKIANREAVAEVKM